MKAVGIRPFDFVGQRVIAKADKSLRKSPDVSYRVGWGTE